MKVLLWHLDWGLGTKGPHNDQGDKNFLGLWIVSNVSKWTNFLLKKGKIFCRWLLYYNEYLLHQAYDCWQDSIKKIISFFVNEFNWCGLWGIPNLIACKYLIINKIFSICLLDIPRSRNTCHTHKYVW